MASWGCGPGPDDVIIGVGLGFLDDVPQLWRHHKRAQIQNLPIF